MLGDAGAPDALEEKTTLTARNLADKHEERGGSRRGREPACISTPQEAASGSGRLAQVESGTTVQGGSQHDDSDGVYVTQTLFVCLLRAEIPAPSSSSGPSR